MRPNHPPDDGDRQTVRWQVYPDGPRVSHQVEAVVQKDGQTSSPQALGVGQQTPCSAGAGAGVRNDTVRGREGPSAVVEVGEADYALVADRV